MSDRHHHTPVMQKLFYALINAWCWLRVAASLTLLGSGLGVGAYFLIEGIPGLAVAAALALLGLIAGIRLANHARRQDHLVEYAYGLPPRTNAAPGAAKDT